MFAAGDHAGEPKYSSLCGRSCEGSAVENYSGASSICGVRVGSVGGDAASRRAGESIDGPVRDWSFKRNAGKDDTARPLCSGARDWSL